MPALRLLLTVATVLLTSGGGTSSARPGLPALSASVPVGPKDGLVRTVEPYGGWTLVCERGQAQRRCNLSQQIVDARGRLAFSWTLAPQRDGTPLLILRGLDEGTGVKSVEIEIARLAPVRATLGTCNQQVCLGALPVTTPLEQALAAGTHADITLMMEGRLTTLRAPLSGLRQAFATLR